MAHYFIFPTQIVDIFMQKNSKTPTHYYLSGFHYFLETLTRLTNVHSPYLKNQLYRCKDVYKCKDVMTWSKLD